MELKEKNRSIRTTNGSITKPDRSVKRDCGGNKMLVVEQIKEWVPENGDEYYYISTTGHIRSAIWRDEVFDNLCLEYLNVYKTTEEAEFARERMKVFRELSLFALEQMPKKHNTEAIYTIECDRGEDDCYITWNFSVSAPVMFESEEMAQKAIDYVGEERLKKYWFRVGGI